jgi:hypothetical protein
MKEIMLPSGTCWNCGLVTEERLIIKAEKLPKMGDVIICMGCGAPSIFCDDCTRRIPTSKEIEAFPKEVMRTIVYEIEPARKKVMHDKVVLHGKIRMLPKLEIGMGDFR